MGPLKRTHFFWQNITFDSKYINKIKTLMKYDEVYKYNRRNWKYSSDVLQDALLKYLESYPDDTEINPALLYTIAKNITNANYNTEMAIIKKNKAYKYCIAQDPLTEILEREDLELLEVIRLEQIQYFLANNTELLDRKIIYTYIFSTLTQEEIGALLGIKRGVVVYSLKKTIEKLSKHFNRSVKSFNKSIRKTKKNGNTRINIIEVTYTQK